MCILYSIGERESGAEAGGWVCWSVIEGRAARGKVNGREEVCECRDEQQEK